MNALPINDLVTRFRLRLFVETGLGDGEGLRHALGFPFSRLWSVEALPGVATEVAEAITMEQPNSGYRWEVLVGDSSEAMPGVLSLIEKTQGSGYMPVLWWLDAHLPQLYTDTPGTVHQLPLLHELRAISKRETFYRDVVIADDWRLYQKRGYGGGQYPHAVLPGAADVEEILQILKSTHTVIYDDRDEGYLLALPLAVVGS